MTTLLDQIRQQFTSRGVPIATTSETEEQRLNRILNEVQSGSRTLESVGTSVQGIANQYGYRPPPPNPYESQLSQLNEQIQRLQQPLPATPIGNDPYTREAMRGFDTQLATYQNAAQNQLNQMAEARTRGVSNQERNLQNALDTLRARMADQGILRSGINVAAQGREHENNVRSIEELLAQYNAGVSGVNTNLTLQTNQINQMRNAAMQQAAQMAAQERLMAEQMRAQQLSQAQMTMGQLQSLVPQGGPVGDAQSLAQQIQQLFGNYGVPIGTSTETEAQRINRIVNEIQSGQRSLDAVNRSIAGIAGTQMAPTAQILPRSTNIPQPPYQWIPGPYAS